MSDALRWGLIVAGALIIGVLALKVISSGGHTVANTAGSIERKL